MDPFPVPPSRSQQLGIPVIWCKQPVHTRCCGWSEPQGEPQFPMVFLWFTMFFLEMVIFGNHFWRLFGQNHAIDELYYLPTFGLFVGKMMVICWFSVGIFHQQLTKTHLVRRTSWIKNSCNAQIRKKKTELSQTVALLQSYMCFFLLFSMFLILLVLIR